MNTLQIIDKIKDLPLSEKFTIVEFLLKQIKVVTEPEDKTEQNRKKAAKILLKDYQMDKELTALTILDKDDFYEAN